MAFCSKCGQQMADGVKFCPSCGNPVQATQQQSPGLGDSYQRFANTPDPTAQFNPQDIANNKAMAILAYLGILVLVPIFAANNSPFARYHANQGLILLIVNIVLMIAAAILSAIFVAISWRLYFLSTLFWLIASIIILAFVIIGIINAASGKAKELPIIGKIRLLR